MSSLQYELLKPELSKFSREIDVKIQEIKADWIRIKRVNIMRGCLII